MDSCSTTEQSGLAMIQVVRWSLTLLRCDVTVFSTSLALMIGCHCQFDTSAGKQVWSLTQQLKNVLLKDYQSSI